MRSSMGKDGKILFFDKFLTEYITNKYKQKLFVLFFI